MCETCDEFWQLRHYKGIFSDPYQVKKKSGNAKKVRPSRMTDEDFEMVINVFGSYQKFIDNAAAVLRQQYKT